MNKNWKTLTSRQVYKNQYFTVEEDDCLRPNGQPGKYFVMRRKPGVVILPYDGQYLYLVNQYRYACQKRLWEFPAGSAESDDYLAEATKELLEETGITAARWTALGEFYCAPGFSDHKGKIFLAEELTLGQHQREASESDIIMQKFTPLEITNMIAKGEILDSWTITPFYFFQYYLTRGQ
jgi:8-oxo-dGTP pyrophosphatase MutT (NUDIX family)